MNYFQLDPANGATAPNFANLFAAYNAVNNFAAALAAPSGTLNRGAPMGNGTNLLTNQRTQLALGAPNIACVAGMMTCTAVIAKCGGSPYFVLHAGSGMLDADARNTLNQLMATFGPAGQAVYVIPRHIYVAGYQRDIDELNALGYDICFITNPGESISSVQVNGAGDLYLA